MDGKGEAAGTGESRVELRTGSSTESGTEPRTTVRPEPGFVAQAAGVDGPAGEGARPRARSLSRRRRENAPGGRRHRHSVSVTPDEQRVLMRLAEEQGVTVPRLLVEAATAARVGETATDRRELLVELFGVHRALGAVGNNLNQLTRAANATGDVSPEMGERLRFTLAALRRQLERLDDTLDGFAQ